MWNGKCLAERPWEAGNKLRAQCPEYICHDRANVGKRERDGAHDLEKK